MWTDSGIFCSYFSYEYTNASLEIAYFLGSLAQRKFSFPRSQYAGIPERALLAFDKSPISISSLSPVLSAHQIPAAFICTLTERSGESLEAFNSEGDGGGEKKAVVQNER